MSTTVPAMKRKQDLKVAGNVYVQNNTVWHAGTLSKSEFTPAAHVGTGGTSHAAVTTTTNGFMIAADKVKLDAIQANSINQTTADGRYLQLTGGALSGNLIINNIGNAQITLNADTDNDAAEAGEPKYILTQDGGIIGAEIKIAQGTAVDGALVLAPFMDYSTASPVKNYSVYIHDKKIWHEGSFNPATKLDATHNGTGGASHAAVTTTVNGFMISTDKSKLDGISPSAKKVASSSTNGNIKIDDVETNVYTHPTTSGNIHLPAGGAAGQWVKWSAAGTGAWTGIDWSDVASKPTSAVTSIDDAVGKRHNQNTDTGTNQVVFAIGSGTDSTTTPVGVAFGSGQKAYLRWNSGFELYKDFSATTKVWSDIKANTFYNKDGTEVSYSNHVHQWAEIQSKPATFTPPIATSTVLGGVKQGTNVSIAADGTISGAYAVATQSTNGLMSLGDKTRLDAMSDNATEVLASGTNGNIVIDGVQTNVYTHPSGDGNLHVPITGTSNNGKILKAGATAGSMSWSTFGFSELTGTLNDTQHGDRAGGTLHAAVTTSTNGFMIASDKSKLDGIESGAINQTTADARYMNSSGDTMTGMLKFDNRANGTFPGPQNGFEWMLSTDGAKMFAYEKANDTTDYVFQLSDNANGADRFVFHFKEWQGAAYDVYPLIMTGLRADFAVPLYTKNLDVTGNITVSGNVDGVDIAALKSAYDLHNHDSQYLKLSGGTITSNLTINGSLDIKGMLRDTRLVTGNTQLINVDSVNGNVIYVGNPATALRLESNSDVVATIGGTNRTLWHTGSFDPSTKSDAGHRHNNATASADGFMAMGDKSKLDTIEASAINQTSADARYLRQAGGTVTGVITSTNSTPLVTKTAGYKSWVLHHPASDSLIFAPSATIDGVDWDWTKQIAFSSTGGMTLKDTLTGTNATFSGSITEGGTSLASKYAAIAHVGSTGAAHGAATQSVNGFMSSADKTKLDGVATNANNYTHPATHALDMITETSTLKVMTAAERTKLAGIADSANNYVHPSTHSLSMITETTTQKIMTDVERTKLAGIENNANNYTHPATHALDIITETDTLKVMTAAERTKLAGVQDNANHYLHPATHSLDMITETATLKVMTDAERTKLAGIQDSSINQTTADGRYLQLAGGTLTGTLNAKAIAATNITTAAESRFASGTYADPHSGTNYGIKASQGIATDKLYVNGNITLTGTVDGVDVAQLKGDFDTHNGSGGSSHALATTTTAGFMSGPHKAKLDGIQDNAINQATADGRYLQIGTGGSVSGDLLVTSTGDAKLIVNADTDNDASEGGEPKVVLTQDGGIIGAEVKLAQSGTADNALVLAPFADYNTVSPVKNYNVFVHDKKVWHEGNFLKSEFTPANHIGTNGSSHAAVTTSVNGFMIASDKSKLDGISANAKKVESSTTNGNIKIDGVETVVFTHLSGDGNLHVPATSTNSNGKFLKAGATGGSISWQTLAFTDVTGTVTDTQHGSRGGGTLHAVATTSVHGFMSSTDKTKLDGIQSSAINQTTADARYVLKTGDTVTGNTTFESLGSVVMTLRADTGDTTESYNPTLQFLQDGNQIGAKIGMTANAAANNGLYIQPNSTNHASGLNDLYHLSADGTTFNKFWHAGNFNPGSKSDVGHTHTVANITDLATNFYNKTEINTQMAAKGDVKSNISNTFTDTNLFTKAGVALKIQPATALGADAVAFQLNNSLGNSLVTIGTAVDETKGKLVINGDLVVTGTTVQSATQDIQGDMNVTGNLNVTGDAVIGNSLTDQTTINGDLRLEGDFMPIGRYIETGRLPIFGIADDFQFETDSVSFEDIISSFATFDVNGGSAFAPALSGATRYYRIMVSYASSGTDDSTLRIVEEGTTNEVISFALPSVNAPLDANSGLGNKARTWMSAHFPTSFAGSTEFQAKKNVSGNLAIRYIELIAYDYYA